jgi:hypothetical protein
MHHVVHRSTPIEGLSTLNQALGAPCDGVQFLLPLDLQPSDGADMSQGFERVVLRLSAAALSMFAGVSCQTGSDAEDEAQAALSIQASATVQPSSVQAGNPVNATVSLTPARNARVDIVVVVSAPDGSTANTVSVPGQSLTSGRPLTLDESIALAPTDPAGTYAVGVVVRRTGSNFIAYQSLKLATFQLTTASSANGCPSAAAFCDDFTQSSLAASYSTLNGTWTRGSGSYTGLDANAWERTRSTLAQDVDTFDVTLIGRSLGDSGLGLVYNGSADANDGDAVIVHPAQFQGVYLKQLVPGRGDVGLAQYSLPSSLAGQTLSLRVTRSGTTVTVYLNGTQVLRADDQGSGKHGRLGLIESTTNNTSGAGAVFTQLLVSSWSLAGPTGMSSPPDAGPWSAPNSGTMSAHDAGTSSPPDAGTTGAQGAPPLPTAVPTGFVRAFTEDFNTPAALGNFDSVYGNKFGEYAGCCSTNQLTVYDSKRVLSVSNGSLFYTLHSENGVSYAAAPQPGPSLGFTYGQYGLSVRLVSSNGRGYKIAFLLWPTQGSWTNEVDFPEVDPDFRAPIRAVSLNTTTANGAHTFSGTLDTGVTFTDNQYHTFLLDWRPGQLQAYVDGKLVQSFPAQAIPAQAMRLSLQAEGWINSGPVPASTVDVVEVPWVYINTYHP